MDLFFIAELAALVQSLSFSFPIGRRKISSEPVQPVQLQRTDPIIVQKFLGISSNANKPNIGCTRRGNRNTTLKMISNQTLMKIASLGGFITASTGYAFHYRIQHDIKENESYKDAINIFRAHKKAVTYLGEPITLGRITYGDGQQILGQKMKYKWFKVSLTGSNTKAKLYYEVILEHKIENKYDIPKIEITFDNIPGKTFVIKDCEINK